MADDRFTLDDEQETFFVGKRVLTRAGLDAKHRRSVAAMAQMTKCRRRYERWQRIKKWLRNALTQPDHPNAR